MEGDILVSIKMTKSMVMGLFIGQMEEFIKDNGKMGNNMFEEPTKVLTKNKEKENGWKERK